MLLKLILILFSFSRSFGYEFDLGLSKKLTRDYIKQLNKTETGKDFYKKYKKEKKKFPKIYLRYSNDDGLAWYEKKSDRIYFNSKYIMIFFDIQNYTDKRIIEVLYFSSDTRKEFVKYSDVVYLHELVHSFQDFRYGDSRYYKNGLFLELEYEAYLISDMYFFEKMKNDKELFIKILKGEYSDIYTAEYTGALLSISESMDDYKNNIELRYTNEINAYVSLNDEEIKRKFKLEENKIISYARGDKENFEEEKIDYEKLKKQKDDYLSFIENFYKNVWPDFSYNVLRFLFNTSFEARNYYSFFNSAYLLEKNKSVYKFEKDKDFAAKEAMIYLEFIDYIKNEKNYERASSLLMSFEKFCEINKKEFPEGLIGLRNENYKKTYLKYSNKIETEKDVLKRKYYQEMLEYFRSKLPELSQ